MSSQNYIKEKALENASEPIKFDTLKIILEQIEKCICKININNGGNGTGFFCLIPFPDKINLLPVLITNNHVLGEKEISKNQKIKFSINNEDQQLEILIDISRKTYTNVEYDITFIELKKSDNLNFNDFLEIDENIFKNGDFRKKSVYVIFYPYGNRAEYSNGVIKYIGEDKYSIEHLCPTKSGASGCPILNLNNNRVIGIHKGASGKNWNLGTFIKVPIEKFYEEKRTKNKIEKDEKNLIKNDNIINFDNEINKQYKGDEYYIEYLSEKVSHCDLAFKVILVGDSGKKIHIYLFI